MRRNNPPNRLDELVPRYASGIRRVLAGFVDFLPAFILVKTLSSISVIEAYGPFSGFWLLALVAILIAAPILVVLEMTTGRTPGKLLLGIRVVVADGSNPGCRSAVVRSLSRIYDFGLTTYFLLLLILWDVLIRRPLPGWASGSYRFVWSETSQRWGDELAGTYVIRGPWNPVRVGSSAPPSLIQGSSNQKRKSVPYANSGIRLRRRTPH